MHLNLSCIDQSFCPTLRRLYDIAVNGGGGPLQFASRAHAVETDVIQCGRGGVHVGHKR